MRNIAFIFPGQGSQYVGMGKYFYDNFKESREVFETANDILKYDLCKKIFEGTLDELSETKVTQPSILTVTIAILKALNSICKVENSYTAGLSLGEYSALIHSGILDFEQAIPLVEKRAEYMVNSLSNNGEYGMSAVLGLDENKILEVIEEVKNIGIIEIANYNCPGQIVVSGDLNALNKADELFVEKGARRSVRLSVKAPFHTKFLSTAAKNFEKDLLNVKFGEKFKIPVLSNVTAEIMNKEHMVSLLSKQIMSSVLWEKSILKMIELGVNTFVEIGPGKSLTGFVKKIDKNMTILNIEDEMSFNKTVKFLGEV